jgi:hypothetical protein
MDEIVPLLGAGTVDVRDLVEDSSMLGQTDRELRLVRSEPTPVTLTTAGSPAAPRSESWPCPVLEIALRPGSYSFTDSDSRDERIRHRLRPDWGAYRVRRRAMLPDQDARRIQLRKSSQTARQSINDCRIETYRTG